MNSASRSTDQRQRLLVLMGTGPFAVPSFEAIDEAGFEIALVVTRPQPPVRSRKGPPPAPVHDWAQQRGHRLITPDDINAPAAVAELAALHPSLLVVCDYGQILRPETLATSRLGGVNLHGSRLPAYRGAAPVQRALLAGERVTGISVIHMTPTLDGGPLLATRSTEINDSETAGELESRLARLGVEATLEAISLLYEWDGKSSLGQRQDQALVSKAPRLKKQEGEIDWTLTSRQIHCHVRGMQPWPVAYTHARLDPAKPSLRIAVKEVADARMEKPSQAVAGEQIPGDQFFVASGDGVLIVKTLQPAGRREMTGAEFLRGHQELTEPIRLGPAEL